MKTVFSVMPPPGCGTLPKNYRHNVAGGVVNDLGMPLSARCYPSLNTTPNVVYTGPKASILNRKLIHNLKFVSNINKVPMKFSQ